MAKRIEGSAPDTLHTVQPAALKTFADMITNCSSWDYPIDVHAEICCQLRINPKVWIVPHATKYMLAGMAAEFQELPNVEAFSDERGNVVFFFDEDWSDEFRLWLIYHELKHQEQFYDKGNAGGDRWLHMGERQVYAAWEREAYAFADQHVGRIVKDFQPYRSVVITEQALPKARSAAPRTALGSRKNLRVEIYTWR